MATLDYPDRDYLSTDELRFYLQITKEYKTLTDEEIEIEKQIIIGRSLVTYVIEAHVNYLLKALEYWKTRFNEKIDVWWKDSHEENRKLMLRIQLSAAVIDHSRVEARFDPWTNRGLTFETSGPDMTDKSREI